MVKNLHLLKKELSVSEYAQLMPPKKARYSEDWQKLSNYVFARCPYCLAKNVDKIDTYSLRRWRMASYAVKMSVFYHSLGVYHCPHFVLVQTFFGFTEVPEEIQGTSIAEETVPYVIGHLVENGLCQAVIHALPVCRIDEDEFIPSYTLFMISYFSQQPHDDVFAAVHRYNDPYYSWEASATLYLPLEFGEPHWANLEEWVAAKKLSWVDAFDPELGLKTGDTTAFPYKGLNKQEDH